MVEVPDPIRENRAREVVPPILTAEQVCGLTKSHGVRVSHEALRARVQAAEAERDDALRYGDKFVAENLRLREALELVIGKQRADLLARAVLAEESR